MKFRFLLIVNYSNRQSAFSPLTPFLPLPKYFGSEWSYAQYRIPTQSSHISINSASARSPTADVPDEERCVVGWIQAPQQDGPGSSSQQGTMEHQLIALTYTGGWYRLSLPNAESSANMSVSPSSGSPRVPIHLQRQRTSSGSSIGRSDKGKEKEEKESGECILKEFRRFGRWDGWG
jgi:WD repeat-containing protein 45